MSENGFRRQLESIADVYHKFVSFSLHSKYPFLSLV
jgi:hypothetical protein